MNYKTQTYIRNKFLNTSGMIGIAMTSVVIILSILFLPNKFNIILVFCLFLLMIWIIMLSKPRLLSIAITAFPSFLILWAIAFPGMSYRLEQSIFPAIDLNFMRARVDELAFYGLFFIWASFMLLSLLNQTRKAFKASLRLINLTIILFIPIVSSTIIGISRNNPEVLNDFRKIIPLCFGIPMAYWALKRITLKWFIIIIKLTVLLLVISNFLLLASYLSPFQHIQYFKLWHLHLPQYGFTILLYVSLLSKAISGKVSLWPLLGILLSLSVALFIIHKWWVLGILVGTLVVLKGTFFQKRSSHFLLNKIFRFGSVFVLIFFLAVVMVMMFREKTASSFAIFEERVLREDIGGDISGGRFLIWNKLVDSIKKNPIIGNGLGYRLNSVRPTDLDLRGSFIEEHNICLWFASRFGIPFTILLAGLCLYFWRVGWQTYRKEKSRFQKILILACVSNFVIILSLSLVGGWFFLFEFSIIICWTIAFVCVIYSRSVKEAITR